MSTRPADTTEAARENEYVWQVRICLEALRDTERCDCKAAGGCSKCLSGNALAALSVLAAAARRTEQAEEQLRIHRTFGEEQYGLHQAALARVRDLEGKLRELYEAAFYFEDDLSDFCDGPLRDRLNAALLVSGAAGGNSDE